MLYQLRHRHAAYDHVAIRLPPARTLRLSGVAMAVSLMLTGCAQHGGNHAVATAPRGTIGTNTLNVADAAIAGGDASMALSVSQSILDKDPNDVDALVHEGDAYYALGRCPAAEAAYEKALKINPKSSVAETGYGRCLLKVNPADAEAAFAAAAQDDPGNGKALSDLGIARDLQGNFAGAADAYRLSLMANPGSIATAVNLGLSLALSGQGAEALQYLGPLATGPEASPKIREDYGLALVSAGRDDDARQVLAIDMPPDKVDRAMAGFKALIAKSITSPPPPAAPAPTMPQVRTAPVTMAPDAPDVPSAPVSTAPTPLLPAASPAAGPAASNQVAPMPVTSEPEAAKPAPPKPETPKPETPKPVALTVAPPVVHAAPEVKTADAHVSDISTADTHPADTQVAYSQSADAAPVVQHVAAPVSHAVPPSAPHGVPSVAEVAHLSAAASAPPSRPVAKSAVSHAASVQIAALKTHRAAQAEWRKVAADAPSLFADKTPEITKVVVSGQTYYRLRVTGFASHENAAQFCSMVKSAGAPCMPAF